MELVEPTLPALVVLLQLYRNHSEVVHVAACTHYTQMTCLLLNVFVLCMEFLLPYMSLPKRGMIRDVLKN
jgi:hypothetical protein